MNPMLQKRLDAIRSAFMNFICMRTVFFAVCLVVSFCVSELLIGLFVTTGYTSSIQVAMFNRNSIQMHEFNNLAVCYHNTDLFVTAATNNAVTLALDRALDSPYTAQELKRHLSAKRVPHTVLVDLTVTAPTPEDAVRYAEAYAAISKKVLLPRLYIDDIHVVRGASVPQAVHHNRDTLLCSLVLAVIASLAVLGLTADFGKYIQSEKDFAFYPKAKVIAQVVTIPSASKERRSE